MTEKSPNIKQPQLQDLLIRPPSDYKISAVPLQFQYIPVQILSKQFTKFNNPHKYRIHYLGPRPVNSFMLHKKYGSIQYEPNFNIPLCSKDFNKYGINMKRIVQSNYINEALRTNSHYKNAIFYRAFEGMNPTLNCKQEIVFNSAFQSGNLDCVIKSKQNTFDLFLRIDSNTRGHTQWYFFSIKNGKKNQKITLNICNITKGKTLYEQGMKPYIFSRKKKQKFGDKYNWQQGGQNIMFQPKLLRYDLIYQRIKVPELHQLSFEYIFEFDHDEIFFAYSIPFTYSQLFHKISFLPQKLVKKDILGQTFTGADIPILHITSFNKNNDNNRKQPKKNILITSRIHPGQSNSSHMVNGFIDFIVSDCKQAEQLRNRVNFFIIPMLNPDGVIMGNSRVSGAGKDLNRQFRSSKFQLYPQVQLLKNFALKLKRKHGIYMYLDFHGHSRKKNTFFYGPPFSISETQYYKCRVLPRLIQNINNSFRYYSCSFNLNDQKKKTARGVMFELLKISYTYTIQSSIGLYYDVQGKLTVQFQEKAWKIMGKNIGQGLAEFIILEEDYQNLQKQRIATRAKNKQLKLLSSKSIKQELKQTLQQIDKDKNIFSFEDLIQDIKQNCAKTNNFDPQLSSDDHDANQDLEDIKLNQFNNIMVQGIQKRDDSKNNQNKFFEQDAFVEQSPTKQFEIKSQLEVNKNNKNNGVQKPKFRNRSISKPQTSPRKQRLQEKLIQVSSPSKTQIFAQKNKNFVLANKQRFSLTTKNFIMTQANRYEIINLPKNIQMIRKQLTKGRILINNLFQNKTKLNNLKQSNLNSFMMQTSSPERQVFTSSKSRRAHIKQLSFSPQKIEKNMSNIERRQSTSNMNRKSISLIRQQKSNSSSFKQTIDQYDYKRLEDYQIDNFAMTIRSFKGRK